MRPGWAGVRFGAMSQPSRIKFARFEQAGQFDYAEAQLAPALQVDLLQHELSNLTFERNYHTALEVAFNQVRYSKTFSIMNVVIFVFI